MKKNKNFANIFFEKFNMIFNKKIKKSKNMTSKNKKSEKL
jgi:hypothetical protein